MQTRRDIILSGSLAVSGLGGGAAFAANNHSTTQGGYLPPQKSAQLLKKVRFDRATPIGAKFMQRFARWDATAHGKVDPSLCEALLEIPGATMKPAVYWHSKMAVDADGASEAVRKQSSGSSPLTSLKFADHTPLNAEIVPYFVAPFHDKRPDGAKLYPDGPWEDSGDSFVADMKLQLGNLGVVIFKDKIAGAIFADEGPAMKIGEASIRVHERIRKPPLPWIGDPANKKLKDASEDRDVLTLVFRDTLFDVNEFGKSRQAEMAAAIHDRALAAFKKFTAA